MPSAEAEAPADPWKLCCVEAEAGVEPWSSCGAGADAEASALACPWPLSFATAGEAAASNDASALRHPAVADALRALCEAGVPVCVEPNDQS